MNYELILSFLGSAIGCVAGILTSQKLTDYRLSRLEEKVEKHNNFDRRIVRIETKLNLEDINGK